MPKKSPKILIMRLSALGDIVNLTAIFSKIREKYPEAEIHFVTKEQFRNLINTNNYGIKVITYNSSTGLNGWRELCEKLALENYDYFLDMHNNIRSRILRSYLKKTKVKKFHKPRLKRFLLFYFLINRFPKTFNLISEYLKVLTILDIHEENSNTEIVLPEGIKTKALDLLKRKGVINDFVVILPIAAWKNKRYDLGKFIKVSNKIVADNDMQVVWMGGTNDDYLNDISLDNSKIIKIIGETSLMESLAILEMARAVIGNDTGLTYAAQALGTPALIIEGPTSRETGAGHCQYGSRILEKELWCRPCSQKGDRKCYRKNQYCLDFTIDEVYAEFNKILSGVK